MTEKTDSKPEERKDAVDSVQKDYSNEISLLSTISRQNSEAIDSLTKSVDAVLEEIKKQSVAGSNGNNGKDENPVDHGTDKQEKPKVSDNDDVGDKPKDDPSYAPDGDAQASIKAPADKPSGTDKVDVAKADNGDNGEKKENGEKNGEKKEEKKEENGEVKKSDTKPDTKPVNKSVSPSGDFEYEMVKAVRPKWNPIPETPSNAPTGYQILKAIDNGWGGKHTSYEQSFIEAYQRLLKGEFGDGFSPRGAY